MTAPVPSGGDTEDQARRDAMNRRIGWGYGYGAGVVDTKRGRYNPSPPPDGTSRRVNGDGALTLSERHMVHYRTCGCLGDAAVCCDPTCECHRSRS